MRSLFDRWHARRHRYRSTACRHGKHARCRLVCKWCDRGCVCRCHRAHKVRPNRPVHVAQPRPNV